MRIFLHENLSYESFFTRKFPDLWYMLVTTCNMQVMQKMDSLKMQISQTINDITCKS